MKRITEIVKNDIKKQKGRALGMLLGNLGASLLGNLLSGKGLYRSGRGLYRSGLGNKEEINKKALMPPHPLTNIDIINYYKNEPRFDGVYSRDNLPEHSSPKPIKNGAYVVNLDEYENTGTHLITLYVKNNEVISFDSFGVIYSFRNFKIYWE